MFQALIMVKNIIFLLKRNWSRSRRFYAPNARCLYLDSSLIGEQHYSSCNNSKQMGRKSEKKIVLNLLEHEFLLYAECRNLI